MTVPKQRTTLDRDRILAGAVALADEIGMESFTMRRLAAALDVKPMAVYHHIPSKEQIIDGMVDVVFAQIELPPPDMDWKSAIRARCISARDVLNRHPWAPPMMESRASPGPATLRHHDAVLGCLRRGGLSLEMTAHAYAILDSFLYGFALEEASLPGGGEGEIVDMADAMATSPAMDEYPYMVEFTSQHVIKPGYSFGNSFEFGLDLIIEGLDQASRGAI